MTLNLSVKQLSKKIKNKKLVDDISFEVGVGEILGFLGPNGSGKTTTIRMITGLIKPSFGEISIAGYDLKKDKINALKNIGAIIENPDLYQYMTGRQNLQYFANLSGQAISNQRIDDVLEMLNLTKDQDVYVSKYSLGMRQRLGIAQAILHNPRILILDEPTNGLDPQGIHSLRKYLKDLANKEGTSIIISSHLLSEIELMCDKVVVIHEGKKILERSVHHHYEDKDCEFKIEVDDAQGLESLSKIQIIDAAHVAWSGNKNMLTDVLLHIIDSGKKIYSVEPVSETLEETFLKVIGNESHD